MEDLENRIKELLRERDRAEAALKKEFGGIFKSANPVADFGEYLASQWLNLQLMAAANHQGYDATGKLDGKRYQVKTRKARDYGLQQMFPVSKEDLPKFDYLVCVGLNSDWEVAFMVSVPSAEVTPNDNERFYLKKELMDKYRVNKPSTLKSISP